MGVVLAVAAAPITGTPGLAAMSGADAAAFCMLMPAGEAALGPDPLRHQHAMAPRLPAMDHIICTGAGHGFLTEPDPGDSRRAPGRKMRCTG